MRWRMAAACTACRVALMLKRAASLWALAFAGRPAMHPCLTHRGCLRLLAGRHTAAAGVGAARPAPGPASSRCPGRRAPSPGHRVPWWHRLPGGGAGTPHPQLHSSLDQRAAADGCQQQRQRRRREQRRRRQPCGCPRCDPGLGPGGAMGGAGQLASQQASADAPCRAGSDADMPADRWLLQRRRGRQRAGRRRHRRLYSRLCCHGVRSAQRCQQLV